MITSTLNFNNILKPIACRAQVINSNQKRLENAIIIDLK